MKLRPSPEWEPIFASMAQLKREWPARGWSWDARLVCVTSSFSGEFVEPAKAALQKAFAMEYTAKTIASSHPYLQEVAERAGGLRANQFAYAATVAPASHLLCFGLWWPWNDQETMSVRIGFAKLEANDEPYPRFRDIFGVSGY
jgi:hypothetical protein